MGDRQDCRHLLDRLGQEYTGRGDAKSRRAVVGVDAEIFGRVEDLIVPDDGAKLGEHRRIHQRRDSA